MLRGCVASHVASNIQRQVTHVATRVSCNIASQNKSQLKIRNIQKQHLQHRESNGSGGRITSATLKHVDLLLQHPDYTHATCVWNSYNISTSRSTFATFACNNCNILLKHLKHTDHRLATCHKPCCWPTMTAARSSSDLYPGREERRPALPELPRLTAGVLPWSPATSVR
jgi:hypothetical protein